MSNGRSEKRIAKTVNVEVRLPDGPTQKQRASTENVSSHGARLFMKQRLKPGQDVVLVSPTEGVGCQAHIVYCQGISEDRFAVGLELRGRVEAWARACQRTRFTASLVSTPGLALRSCFFFRILISMARVTLGASPKAEASLFGPHFGKIHETPVLGATDSRPKFLIEGYWILGIKEIPTRRVVANQAAGLPANV